MHSTDQARYFLMIEPRGAPTLPVIDAVTDAAATLLTRLCRRGEVAYRGTHACTGPGCPARSDNRDHYVPDGRVTNSLLVHYVACHRLECPPADVAVLASLAAELAGNGAPGSWIARSFYEPLRVHPAEMGRLARGF